MIGEYDLMLRGLSYERAREIADEAYGGTMVWHNGKAYPFDNDNPVEILKRERCSATIGDKGAPLITPEMKRAAFGKFYAPRLDEPDESEYQARLARLTIPWAICKAIYIAMANAGGATGPERDSDGNL